MIHITNQKLLPKEVIQNVFSPLVAVVTSPQAEEIAVKNNLTFVELIQPFGRIQAEVACRDAVGGCVSMKGLNINFCDINWRPPQTMLAQKMLNDAVSNSQSDATNNVLINGFVNTNLDVPKEETWFEHWREIFFSVQYPSDHEFTRHILATTIVLSAADPTVIETANQLTRKVQMMQNITPPKLPKWISNTDALITYVLLHDSSFGDITRAQQPFELLKSTFGEMKCFLLQINSGNSQIQQDVPDYWKKFLRRHPKGSELASDQSSAPKTPQDIIGVTEMPIVHDTASNLATPPSGIVINEEVVIHPLSPVQEQGVDVIHSHFSTSSESLSSQIVNPNVWAQEHIDTDQPHGVLLSNSDIENIKHMVHNFAVRSLVPYVERLIGLLNDSITNKKGVSRSLLSATKRWFVTNKPGVNATTQNAVVYTNESTELQTRKLGDLYFMFGNYNLAYQCYHQAKRDFNADSAWQYYAGALEMAALSAYMMNTSNRKTYDYMEEAIVTYLNSCKLHQLATRATLLSIEILKAVKLYGEAAKQLIRMTNEGSDLRSALFLEQAAYMFLMSKPALYRKYAFHIVLAGHRYSKAGQRKHAFRCYKQAYQVFEDRGWSLAEDHIKYTIGKQAVTLKKMDEASSALAHLLRPLSLQNVTQQAAFLREYIATQKTLLKQNPNIDLVEISLPKIVHNSVKVLVTTHPPVATPNMIPATNININTNLTNEWIWHKLEEMIVNTVSNKPVMVFKPTMALFTTDNPAVVTPLGIHGEPIEISFMLENTIKPSITFEDIHLLWNFTSDDGHVYNNRKLFTSKTNNEDVTDVEKIIIGSVVKQMLMAEYERKSISIRLTPKITGQLQITGVVGLLSVTNEPANLWGQINFQPLLIRKKEIVDKNKQIFDKKLDIKILPPAPVLQVSFSKIPNEILAGEIIPITMCLTNSGGGPIGDIYLACENPRWLLIDSEESEVPLSIKKEYIDFTNEALSKDKEARKQHVVTLRKSSDGSILSPEESFNVTVWIQAPYEKGNTDLKILLFYKMPKGYPSLEHRLVRHIFNLQINESLKVHATCNLSNTHSKEVGIDLNVQNLNQLHHSLSTEVKLKDISVLCNRYRLDKDRIIYLNGPSTANPRGYILKQSECLSCRFELNDAIARKTKIAEEYINERLSTVLLSEDISDTNNLPNINKINSFLMKHETKYIGFAGQQGALNTEEFNNLVSSSDKHMTVAISWQAVIYNGEKVQRVANGQHFLNISNLYEQSTCPLEERHLIQTFNSQETHCSIYDCLNKKNNDIIKSSDDDSWGFSSISMAHRCLLECEKA